MADPVQGAAYTVRLSRMRVLGIEFAAKNMNYVLVIKDGSNLVPSQANRLTLGTTRDREALNAFQNAVLATLNAVAPDRIAVKLKPESGSMSAGAAAMKMEAIVLANAGCPVEFVSGARINGCTAECGLLRAYHLPAFKAAAVVFESP